MNCALVDSGVPTSNCAVLLAGIGFSPLLFELFWRNDTFFFFQAEDGIRDWSVTGVQTCALPISPRGCDVYEEGVWIPITKLMVRGERNREAWKFILANVREPEHMAGDLHAQMASGEVGAKRVQALCDAHALDDIEDLADEIISRSEEATRRSIRALPAGTYHAQSTLDLADGSEIVIAVALTVDPRSGTITVDYEGSSEASPFGINVVKNYTHAYTTFTVRSVLNPEIPNNSGSLAPIEVKAPPGSIVNAQPPSPCTARHVVGMFLPMPLLKALAQVVPQAD